MKRQVFRALKSLTKLVLFIAVCIAGYYAYTYYNAEEVEEGLGELPTAVAEVRDITVSVSATGVLEPIKVIEVKSRASGEILNMPVEMGDLVERGQLLVQVDTRILDQEFKQADADLQSAITRKEIAERQYLRAQDLHQQDLISENDLEASEQNATNAQATLLRSEASLQLARERREDATVNAPISGTIISKAVEEGVIITSSTSNVSGGTTLVQMADLSRLQIRTLVDEIDIGKVLADLEVESTVEAFPNRTFNGAVLKIEPQAVVQQSVTTFPVLSFVDNSEGMLLPGMNADVNIIIHRRPGVLSVPNEAVKTPEDAAQVVAMFEADMAAAEEVAAAGGEPSDRPAAEADSNEAPGAEPGAVPAEESRPGGPGGGRGGEGAGGGEGTAGAREGMGPGGQGGGQGGGPGAGRGGGFGDMDMSDPEVRARVEEMRNQRRAQMEAEASDPWGVETARRQAAVVFVLGEDGLMTPRQIVTGVRDWERTEVIEGLQPGDQVVILPSTSLLRSQEDLRQRFSGRSMIPGMGGGGGGGRGGPPH
jgi:HlyD family secretion protein